MPESKSDRKDNNFCLYHFACLLKAKSTEGRVFQCTKANCTYNHIRLASMTRKMILKRIQSLLPILKEPCRAAYSVQKWLDIPSSRPPWASIAARNDVIQMCYIRIITVTQYHQVIEQWLSAVAGAMIEYQLSPTASYHSQSEGYGYVLMTQWLLRSEVYQEGDVKQLTHCRGH